MQIGTSSKLILTLLMLSLFSLALLLVGLSFLISLGNWLFVIGALSLLVLAVGIWAFSTSLKHGHLLSILIKPTSYLLKFLYPVIMTIGGWVGISKDDIRSSYIVFHNRLAAEQSIRVKGSEILVLLPHCLQWSECPYKITNAVDNCRHCGRCQISDLLEMRREYGFHLAVATGGTLARKIIKELRPRVVIGVACERDLVSGMQDVKYVHVVGLVNERPFGPCFNTAVDLDALRERLLEVMI